MRARNGTAIGPPGRALRVTGLAMVGVLALAAVGCRQDMHDQAKYEPLEASVLFTDGKASRPLVEGTVARGHLRDDAVFSSVAPICSAIDMNRLLNTSSMTGSTSVPIAAVRAAASTRRTTM